MEVCGVAVGPGRSRRFCGVSASRKEHGAYWIFETVDGVEKGEVFIYLGKKTDRDIHRFVHRALRRERDVDRNDTFAGMTILEYVEAAEAVTRAQKAIQPAEGGHLGGATARHSCLLGR